MLFPPKSLTDRVFTKEELESDKKVRNKYEDCGLGKKALYVGKFGLGRRRYIPLGQITRVYKRLAVSKGYFEGNVYGTISYLVIMFGKNEQKVVRFMHEENLDAMLNDIKAHTKIPVGKPK